ncbi:hypothetical protein MBENS4_0654 [Novosphingobium sp. MBES04]|nr:hypothetical protein MBENS4_0654 [Novosphingobium sp. MBES04]
MGRSLFTAASLIALAWAPQASAQEQAATNGDTVVGADIVVTALKRSTSIQETPISISAVTGETMANSGVQDIADLAASAPGLSFVDGGPSQRRVVIRGIQARASR